MAPTSPVASSAGSSVTSPCTAGSSTPPGTTSETTSSCWKRITSFVRLRACRCASTTSPTRRRDQPRRPARLLDGGRVDLLLVHHPPQHRLHSRALVEAERSRLVFGVDAETDAVLAALPEAPEGVVEQRGADALLPPPAASE